MKIFKEIFISSLKRCTVFKKCPSTLYYRPMSSLKNAEEISNLKFVEIPVENIRNFSIIAHVDHGKSTLADRILEITGAIKKNVENKQVLDRLQVERERGITVKAQSASIIYNYKGTDYLLNLIDTPGHVDFSNEVSRSLAACQGVILLVDANQGVQAQTVANFYLAFTQELTIMPVLNKIDLKNSDPEGVTVQLQNLFGINKEDVLKISAKTGTGVVELLHAIIERVPHPPADRSKPLQAILFDSWYDRFRGVFGLFYIANGRVSVGDNIRWIHAQKEYQVKSLGVLTPEELSVSELVAGQVGFIACNMRDRKDAIMGDTVVSIENPAEALPGLMKSKPMVFAGVYPLDQSQHPLLRSAIERLTLNDSAVSVIIDSSPALGQGWRLGFLGLLHLEVFSQRLEQEYGAHAILTTPNVTYKVVIHGSKNISALGGSELYISNPTNFPDPNIISEMYEPIVKATIITPDTYLGGVLSLCMERRGQQESAVNIDNSRVLLKFSFPLSEIIVDFHDRLKSLSSGFASFDYEDAGYVASNLVKIVILLNGLEVEELSSIVHSSRAVELGKRMCHKLVDIIPRQQFQIAVQAKVGGKIVARDNIKPYRKDVTAKLYGGDVTRRMKLLKRQAEGKKKLRMIGNIALPRETFIEILKR
ncbi:translation factor GUF1 homolog, mitochondrial [Halyomorpha halys]|uniref:translation factor GUF1 homolog, mitochondrial n=1 Tax=Halyomorpha halys TaxID=286706 RepID=UPI0006D4C87C|nr:translation factor GUF1 homolog, mitochondrial [Halyomorpha halys]